MHDLISRKAFYEEISKSSVRQNFTEDDFEYLCFLLFRQPAAGTENEAFLKGAKWTTTKNWPKIYAWLADLLNRKTEALKRIFSLAANAMRSQMLSNSLSKSEIGGGADEEKAQVAWCILNRVDDVGNDFRDTIRGVVTQSGQFHGYSYGHPVTDANYKIAKDVVYRWIAEKHGVEIERELPSGYCWFSGYGGHNHFRNVY